MKLFGKKCWDNWNLDLERCVLESFDIKFVSLWYEKDIEDIDGVCCDDIVCVTYRL